MFSFLMLFELCDKQLHGVENQGCRRETGEIRASIKKNPSAGQLHGLKKEKAGGARKKKRPVPWRACVRVVNKILN